VSYPKNDSEFFESVVASVDTTSFGMVDGFHLGLGDHRPIEPKPGMPVRIYGKMFGTVRGLFIDGHEFFYRTPKEDEARHKEWVADKNAKDKTRYAEQKEDMDRRVQALPPALRTRIERFRANNPDFGWQFEGYELFCCEQAVAIADALPSAEAIHRFRDLDWDDQKKMVPGLDDGHSGNTFGCACVLAQSLLQSREREPAVHGALAPLVGSKAYGEVGAASEEQG